MPAKRNRWIWLVLAGLSLALSGWPFPSHAQTPSNAGVTIIAIKGQVMIKRARQAVYRPATTNMVLVVGDSLNTSDFSEATLKLSDESLGRVDELTDLLITAPGPRGGQAEITVREGGFYLLNRDKNANTKFRTPIASGAILGTEFAVRVATDGSTRVFLFEGRVDLENALGAVQLGANEEATVLPNQAPVKSPMLDVVAPIQWTLYYPAVLDPAAVGSVSAALNPALAAYAEGNLREAIALGLQAATGTPGPLKNSDALLLAQLALAAGQPERALKLLGSVETAEAVALARQAVAQSPNFGAAWTRVAELEFANGRSGAANDALKSARKFSPRHAQALALEGFVLASRHRVGDALDAFESAIAADSRLGNAWLGRGLARIKSGDLAGGRQDLQTAAAMEPTRSVTRSYLGKAFAAENNPVRAVRELDRARELDPNDPTSWLYSALVRQQANRLNEAVADLEQSKALNDQRNLYRSRQLLDQDRAVRGANLASVYRDAGLVDWGVREAGRAVQFDYANASAHLFLASAYDTLRDPRGFNLRYETPWFSELLLANLLAPIGAGPLSQNVSLQEYSQLLESDRIGLTSLTEYYGNGTWNERGSQFGTFGGSSYAIDFEYRHEAGMVPNTDLTHKTVYGKFKQQMGPADQLFAEVIYTQNENGDNRAYYDPSAASRSYRFRERQEPNVFLGWNHEWSPGNHTLLLAGHLDDRVEYSATDVPLPLIRRVRPSDPPVGLDLGNAPKYKVGYESEFSAWTTELQQIATLRFHTVVLGGRYQAGDSDTVASQSPLPIKGPLAGRLADAVETVDARLGRISAYLYDTWQMFEPLHLTAGLSYERVEHPVNIDLAPIQSGVRHSELVAPKLGLLWTIHTNTHVRAAWTRSLGGTFYDTSIRLEPVQVAGFTQSYRSLAPESVTGLVPGTEFETVSAGIDHQFPTHTYLGVVAEWLRSDASQTLGAFDSAVQGRLLTIPASVGLRLPYDERSVLVNVNQLLGKHWSIGLHYRGSEADLDQRYEAPYGSFPKNSPERSYQAVLHQMNGFLQYAHAAGFYAQFFSRWNGQSVRGFSDPPGDDFWQFDAFVGYRFSQRRVDVRLGVLNLTSQDYRLQPLNVREEYPRQRMVYGGLRLTF